MGCLAVGGARGPGRRRSCSISSRRSAASSLAIRASTSATSWSERSRRTRPDARRRAPRRRPPRAPCPAPTASRISSPSSCEAASTRSAIWAGCRRARRREREPQPGRRDVADERLDLRPGHELAVLACVAAKAAREKPARRGRGARVDAGDAPGTVALTSSTSRAVTRRAVPTLIRLRPSTSARNSTSPGRRSNCARSSFVVDVLAPPGSSLPIRSPGTNSSRPPIGPRRP